VVKDLPDGPLVMRRSPVGLTLGEPLDLSENLGAATL
jgi:hypothetical protein